MDCLKSYKDHADNIVSLFYLGFRGAQVNLLNYFFRGTVDGLISIPYLEKSNQLEAVKGLPLIRGKRRYNRQ